ncbi:MAG: FliA/WhiG family RNA polymerase sigma factor [Ilumatobacteraceae bacterium]
MNARPIRLTIDEAWNRWNLDKDIQAREWLLIHYASLIKFVAGRLAAGLPKRVETADLVSAGVFGLMNAIDRYEPGHGAKFETYAIPRIRGAILDSLRALDWVPRIVRSRSRTIETTISQLEHELGRSPTDEEIASKIHISDGEFQKWLSDIAASAVGPLDHVMADNAATPTHSDAYNTTSPDAVVDAEELRKVMRQEIKKLPERERTVLVLYYDENLTLNEIGDVLGVTESRVSQIHTKAVLQLRSRLHAADVA